MFYSFILRSDLQVLDPKQVPEKVNDPTEKGHKGEEEGVTEVRVLGPGPDLLQLVWRQAVHRDRVFVVAGVGAAHRLGPPHELWIMGQLQIELRGGAEPGQEHVLQGDKWGAASKQKIKFLTLSSFENLRQSAGVEDRRQ